MSDSTEVEHGRTPSVFGIVLVIAFAMVGAAGNFSSPCVDGKGTIRLPRDYGEKWGYLGGDVVPDEKAPGYGFHDVFTQPGSAEAFKKTGKFPDGAVLVKRLLSPGPRLSQYLLQCRLVRSIKRS